MYILCENPFFPFSVRFPCNFLYRFYALLSKRISAEPAKTSLLFRLHDTYLFLSFLNDSQFQTVADETSSNKLSQFANLNSVRFKAKSPVSHQNTKSGFLFLSPNVNILRFPILFHFFVAAVVAFVASLKPGKANTTYFFPFKSMFTAQNRYTRSCDKEKERKKQIQTTEIRIGKKAFFLFFICKQSLW